MESVLSPVFLWSAISIEDARAADGDKKALKKRNPSALKISVDENMTFQELADWYFRFR